MTIISENDRITFITLFYIVFFLKEDKVNKILFIIAVVCLVVIPLGWFKGQYSWMSLPEGEWKPIEKPKIVICKGKWKNGTLITEREN